MESHRSARVSPLGFLVSKRPASVGLMCCPPRPPAALCQPLRPPPQSQPLSPPRPWLVPQTHAALLGIDVATEGAWASLLGSATIGLVLERRSPVGRALGASLLAFLLQAVAANLGTAPAASPAYDTCWGSVLPASLSLSVLLAVAAAAASNSRSPTSGISISSSSSSSRSSSGSRSTGRPWLSPSLVNVSVAYFWGALGSLVGAVLALHATAALFPASAGGGGLAWPVLARVAAAVAATYVGGSVNFFQVARAVGLDRAEGGKPGLMGAVAGADIFLMAVYFAALVRFGGAELFQISVFRGSHLLLFFVYADGHAAEPSPGRHGGLYPAQGRGCGIGQRHQQQQQQPQQRGQ